MGPSKKCFWSLLVSPAPSGFARVVLVNVVRAALLCFSSLHLCRISKLLWCTGCCRKLKLSTLFKTAQAAASSCPWRSKTQREKRTEKEGGGAGQREKNTGKKQETRGGDKRERERERNDRLDGRGEKMKRCSRLPEQNSWKDGWRLQTVVRLWQRVEVCLCASVFELQRSSTGSSENTLGFRRINF